MNEWKICKSKKKGLKWIKLWNQKYLYKSEKLKSIGSCINKGGAY